MLIPLVCTQCSGKLEINKSQVIESHDTVIVLDNQTFKCPHCGMEYLPGEKIKHFPQKPVISIGGSVTGSTIIVGNGLVVNNNPNSASPKETQELNQHHSVNPQLVIKTEEHKPSKKWWQFWKD